MERGRESTTFFGRPPAEAAANEALANAGASEKSAIDYLLSGALPEDAPTADACTGELGSRGICWTAPLLIVNFAAFGER